MNRSEKYGPSSAVEMVEVKREKNVRKGTKSGQNGFAWFIISYNNIVIQ